MDGRSRGWINLRKGRGVMPSAVGSEFRYMERKAIVSGTEVLNLGGQLAPTLASFTRAIVGTSTGKAYLGPVLLDRCAKLVEQFEQFGPDWIEAAPPGRSVRLLDISSSNILQLAQIYRYLARGEAVARDLAALRAGLVHRL
jgi:hypothetical protein